MKNFLLIVRFFHLYLEKYVVLILCEKKKKKIVYRTIDHPCHFKSHWIFSEFSLNVKVYHRFSQNQFLLFHTFFSNIMVSPILVEFASNLKEKYIRLSYMG